MSLNSTSLTSKSTTNNIDPFEFLNSNLNELSNTTRNTTASVNNLFYSVSNLKTEQSRQEQEPIERINVNSQQPIKHQHHQHTQSIYSTSDEHLNFELSQNGNENYEFWSEDLNLNDLNNNSISSLSFENNLLCEEKLSATSSKTNNSIQHNNTSTLTQSDIFSSDIIKFDTVSDIKEDEFLQNDQIVPTYKLRADQKPNQLDNSDCDWIKAPGLFIDEQQVSELTYEQIKFTLDYFILSGYRVSQMTKTYYDIDAVTKLLDEKEKDLELAATIGKQLLEKDQQLEVKIEFLEVELEKTSEMVNQLRHEITLKDDLLKCFIESENESYFDSENGVLYKKRHEDAKETISDYKKKIVHLENENETLRGKADYFEKEAKNFELKETIAVENCLNQLEATQEKYKISQKELKSKTAECSNQQEHIQNLLTQILELQQKIKSLKKDNHDLKSLNESSISELLNQLTDLKEKYNECIVILDKTQSELSLIRNRNQNNTTVSTADASTLTSELDQNELSNYNFNSNNNNKMHQGNNHLKQSSSLYSPWMPINNSLAAELYQSLTKDYLDKTANLSFQASQSSEFIKQVKKRLITQIPSSSLDQSGTLSAFKPVNNQNDYFINEKQHSKSSYHCQTPDSMLSTGSASVYSSLMGRSSSLFVLPEKLQIVKPIEGSQTLQHWQHLAKPNLGCLFENRPGISLAALKSDSDELLNKLSGSNESLSKIQTSFDATNDYDADDYDDGVNLETYFENDEGDMDEDDEEVAGYDDSYDFNYYKHSGTPDNQRKTMLMMLNNKNNSKSDLNIFNNKFEISEERNRIKSMNARDQRILSPSKMELLTRLLENEERNYNDENTDEQIDEKSSKTNEQESFLMSIFRSLSTKYFKSNSFNSFDPVEVDEIEKNNEIKNSNETKTKKKNRNDYDDPDTPPSSPINLPNSESYFNNGSNVLYDVIETAKTALVNPISNYFQNARSKKKKMEAPTPPGTPTNFDYDLEMDEKNTVINSADVNGRGNDQQEHTNLKMNKATNFFDQITRKLGVFSFKSQTTPSSGQINKLSDYTANLDKKSSTKEENDILDFSLQQKPDETEEENNDDKEIEQIFQKQSSQDEVLIKCKTPPPSPSKFTPPLPDLDDDDYDEKDLRNSAFIRLSTLNPYINKSSLNLESLLGSLTSLKRINKTKNF